MAEVHLANAAPPSAPPSLIVVKRMHQQHADDPACVRMFLDEAQLALCLSAFTAMFLSPFGLRTIFLVAIVPQVLAACVSLLFIEPRIHTAAKQKNIAILKEACISIYRNPKLMLVVAGTAISYGAGEAKFKFQSAFVNVLWPTWAVGLYRGINHALSFFGFRMAGHLIDRFKEPRILVVRDAYWFLSGMLAVILKNAASPLVFITGALFFGPGEVASDHLMQKEFTDEQRATMGSVASFVTSIVFAIAAFAIGMVSDRFGLVAGTGFSVCLGLAALPINLWLYRRHF